MENSSIQGHQQFAAADAIFSDDELARLTVDLPSWLDECAEVPDFILGAKETHVIPSYIENYEVCNETSGQMEASMDNLCDSLTIKKEDLNVTGFQCMDSNDIMREEITRLHLEDKEKFKRDLEEKERLERELEEKERQQQQNFQSYEEFDIFGNSESIGSTSPNFFLSPSYGVNLNAMEDMEKPVERYSFDAISTSQENYGHMLDIAQNGIILNGTAFQPVEIIEESKIVPQEPQNIIINYCMDATPAQVITEEIHVTPESETSNEKTLLEEIELAGIHEVARKLSTHNEYENVQQEHISTLQPNESLDDSGCEIYIEEIGDHDEISVEHVSLSSDSEEVFDESTAGPGSSFEESIRRSSVKERRKHYSLQERKARKKEQNKQAALRYRSKKKKEEGDVLSILQREEEKQKLLQEKYQTLQSEVLVLKKLMSEVLRNRKDHR